MELIRCICKWYPIYMFDRFTNEHSYHCMNNHCKSDRFVVSGKTKEKALVDWNKWITHRLE